LSRTTIIVLAAKAITKPRIVRRARNVSLRQLGALQSGGDELRQLRGELEGHWFGESADQNGGAEEEDGSELHVVWMKDGLVGQENRALERWRLHLL
jgi:hypothetical protein